jgi:hypothetical protein
MTTDKMPPPSYYDKHLYQKLSMGILTLPHASMNAPPPSYYDSFLHRDLKTKNMSTPSIELDALPAPVSQPDKPNR